MDMLAQLQAAYQGDAIFRPSSIARNINCRGSAQLIARSRHARQSSRFAMEGSAAHVVAEQALKGIRQPEEWTDRMVKVDGEMGGFFVDDEMVESVNTYVDVVRSRQIADVELMVEQRMSLAAMDATNPILNENRGTADAVLLNKPRKRISIVDLKYGKGVMVAGDSPQLKNYGVLAVLNHPFDWKEVELVVSQPRATYEHDRLKSFVFTMEELLNDFLGKLLEAMYTSMEPDAELKTGSWCRWCPAKDAGTCPAVQMEALTIGRDSFQDAGNFTALANVGPVPQTIVKTGEAIPPTGAIIMPDAGMLSPDDCAAIMDRIELFDTYLNAVRTRAVSYIQAGITVPGWTMGAREGNRKWIADADIPEGVDAETVDEALLKLGVKASQLYPSPKRNSPAQIEKALQSEKRDLIAPLVRREMGDPKLKRSTQQPAPSIKEISLALPQ